MNRIKEYNLLGANASAQMKLLYEKYKKFYEWIDLPQGSFWIAGGCLRDHFCRSKVHDIDIFFPSKEKCDEFQQKLLDLGCEEVAKRPHSVYWKTKFGMLDVVNASWYSKPEDVVNWFDFTICSICLDQDTLYAHENFFIDLASKQLVINNLPEVHGSMLRLRKYLARGYTICSGEMYTMFKEMKLQGIPDPKDVYID